MKLKYIIGGLCLVALLVVGVAYVHANPSQILTNPTAVATTTIVYMTGGTATTTNAFDTQKDGQYVPETSTLEIQFTASSTASVLTWQYEYSDGIVGIDCTATPLACDWYSDSLTVSSASSTPSSNLTQINSFTWTFASSTIGGLAVSTTNNRASKIVNVRTPVRYVRAVFSCGAGGQPCAVWSNFQAKKENR